MEADAITKTSQVNTERIMETWMLQNNSSSVVTIIQQSQSEKNYWSKPVNCYSIK